MPSLPCCEALVLLVVVAGVGAGATVDLLTRHIPNSVTVLMAAAGTTLAATGISHVSLAGSLLGFALGMLLMMPGHALGATGAGDVKLMGAVGAVVGPQLVVMAFLFTAITGGILALFVAWRRGRLAATVGRTARMVAAPAESKRQIAGAGSGSHFPYGPAIAIGSIAALVL
jgi:prepilin peptidase CpaA